MTKGVSKPRRRGDHNSDLAEMKGDKFGVGRSKGVSPARSLKSKRYMDTKNLLERTKKKVNKADGTNDYINRRKQENLK